jgi:hypothetical protein
MRGADVAMALQCRSNVRQNTNSCFCRKVGSLNSNRLRFDFVFALRIRLFSSVASLEQIQLLECETLSGGNGSAP